MYWRADVDKFGDQYSVRLFVSKMRTGTFVGVGELTMREEEWEDLRAKLGLRLLV
jgi:hypothetical protein